MECKKSQNENVEISTSTNNSINKKIILAKKIFYDHQALI